MRGVSKRTLGGAVALAALVAAAVTGAGAQDPPQLVTGAPPPAGDKLRVTAASLVLPPGGDGVLRVTAQVEPGWHVNANPPSEDYLIPTEVVLELPAGLTAGALRYPAGKSLRFGFSEEPLLVYDGEIVIEVPVTAAPGMATGKLVANGDLRYQACNDELCLAPASVRFPLAVTVDAAAPSERIAGGAPPAAAGDGRAFTSAGQAGNQAGDTRAQALGRGFAENPLLAFALVFGMGLALNLTPCVYPMLSVTLALFGSRTERSAVRRLPAALAYALGIAAMYSALGLVAALTGTLFGALLQSPWVLIGIAVLLAAMALSMFGLYELQAPSGLLEKLGGQSTAGLLGVFVSGLVVGVFAAPCIGPPIVALLAVVAQSGNPWFGFWTFFVLSLGLGAPYVVLATYTGLLQKLPRSGEWMVWVKKLFGVVLLGVALFYFLLAVRDEWSYWVVPAVLVLGGVYLGFLEKTRGGRIFAVSRRALGVVAVAAGVWLVLSALRQGVTWEAYSPQALGVATAERQPVILDFTASWCIPCKELEHVTFADPEVVRGTANFRRLRVDLTDYDSPESAALRERFGVRGVPTVIFLGAGGQEVPETRVVGFVPPDEFARLAQRALAHGLVDTAPASR